MTPSEAKRRVLLGEIRLKPGFPAMPGYVTSRTRRSMESAVPAVRKYLFGDLTAEDLAKEAGTSRQNITKLLARGVEFLEETGHFSGSRKPRLVARHK